MSKIIVMEETVTEVRRYQFEVPDNFVMTEENVKNEAYKYEPRIKGGEVESREIFVN